MLTLRDIKELFPVLPPFLLSGTALLLASATWFFLRFKNRRIFRPVLSETGQLRTAADSLEHLSGDYRQGRVSHGELFRLLADIVARFLLKEAGPVRLTSEEIIAAANVCGEMRIVAAEFFQLCDKVKFGGSQPAEAEVRRAFQAATTILSVRGEML